VPLPAALVALGAGLIGGAIQGGLSNNQDRRAAERNLQNAQAQAALYELRVSQLAAVASTEAGGLFDRAAEVRGDRVASMAARGISPTSPSSSSADSRETSVVLRAVNTVVSNAYMEASNFRVQGRMNMKAARQTIDEIRSRRNRDVMLGGLTGLFSMGTNILANRASR
jgi:hypothetical protein